MCRLKQLCRGVLIVVLACFLFFSLTVFADENDPEPEAEQIEMQAESESESVEEKTSEAEVIVPETTSSAEAEAEPEGDAAIETDKKAENARGVEDADSQEPDPSQPTTEAPTTSATETTTEEQPSETETDPQPEVKNGWVTEGNDTFYYVNDKRVKNTFRTIEGAIYLFDEEGRMMTNTISKETLNGCYRGFGSDGKMLKSRWLVIDGNKYYLDSSGRLVVDKLAKIEEDLYLFDSDGKLMTNVISREKINDYYRGFGADGRMLTSSWLTYNGAKYYIDANRHVVTNAVKKIGSDYYCFDANGRMQTNSLKKIGSYYYFFGSDGKRATGWRTINGNKYYFNPSNGRAYVSGLKTISGAKYAFASDGKMLTGWQKVGGKTRYFDTTTGKLASGITKIGTKTYLLNSDGVKITSTGTHNGKYIIIKSNGEVLTGKGWTMYNGYKYYIESDGYSVRTDTASLVKGSKLILKVNKKKCVVTVYAYDSSTKKYDIPVKSFVCSPGKRTPLGRHYLNSKNRWVKLVGSTPDTYTWGQWGMFYNKEQNSDGSWSKRFFHSVYYDNERDANSLNVRAYNMLGKICSHGCIRLEAVNAKWLYDNKTRIKYVTIYESDNPGPFGLKRAVKLPSWHTWDPTDPTMHYKCKAKGCH